MCAQRNMENDMETAMTEGFWDVRHRSPHILLRHVVIDRRRFATALAADSSKRGLNEFTKPPQQLELSTTKGVLKIVQNDVEVCLRYPTITIHRTITLVSM